ncbi:Pol polyprotein [Plakobranchus ocellatus]|uniref:Pol polyprotein n=1 Tax=Plakobranchus ocellatus TaxID=259542 RepID=A0AAV4DQX1_9GAST|nr:Pol polyprotein [Plakobranchus ocellatus]
MCESDKKYTAFQTSRGLMEFNYTPFGLSTAACTFQKTMDATLGALPFVVSYFAAVVVFSISWEEHLIHVEKTLETLQRAKFTITPSKTTIGNTSVEFLGHIVSGGEIKPDNAKTQNILDIRTPNTNKKLERYQAY